jgi:hypothetical protein
VRKEFCGNGRAWAVAAAPRRREVGAVGALLVGPDGGFITASDFLMDGGVTAAYWYGDVAEAAASR